MKGNPKLKKVDMISRRATQGEMTNCQEEEKEILFTNTQEDRKRICQIKYDGDQCYKICARSERFN